MTTQSRQVVEALLFAAPRLRSDSSLVVKIDRAARTIGHRLVHAIGDTLVLSAGERRNTWASDNESLVLQVLGLAEQDEAERSDDNPTTNLNESLNVL